MTTTQGNTSPNEDHAAMLQSRLESLLEEAGTLIDQLEAVGARQRQAVESEQVQQIVEIVSIREPIVQGMIRVGEELGAFIEDPGTRTTLGQQTLERALRRIASFEHAMKLMRERDAQDQQHMEQTREKLAVQLAGTGTGRNALRAYSTRNQQPNPIMQDKRG
jgi:hypothetical protein